MDWLAFDTEVSSRQDLVTLLRALAQDLRADPGVWSTTDLAEFFDRMALYAGGPIEGFTANMRPGADADEPSWRRFADILAGARVYE